MSSPFLSPVLWYLGKLTLISAILYGYYRAFLRNASFHPYNRWYMLGSILLSLVLPFLHVPFPTGWLGGERYAGVFSAIAGGGGGSSDEMAPVILTGPSHSLFYGWFHGRNGWFGGWRGLYILYGVVCGVFAGLLFRSLYYLLRLPGRYASSRVEGVRFFQTEEPGTPFSFLNLLFWNKELPLDTEQGQFILRHELYHIRQRHTLDLLALESVRCLFWCNPFFHLIVREVKVIHEFLADRYALSAGRSAQSGWAVAATAGSPPAESDRYAYAEWLVWQSVRGDVGPGIAGRALFRRGVAHSFFNTHLKRRITMITQSNHSRPRYISRVMALPLLFLLFGLFAAKAPASPAKTPAGPLSPSGGRLAASGPTHLPINSLVSFYLHQLRYPAAALKQGREETIWFSVRIGEHNQFQQFNQYDVAPDLKGRKAYTITVTSLPARFPDSQGPLLTDQNRNAVFLEEARKASEKISSDTSRVFAPGEYFFTVVYKIEKPAR